MALAAFPNLALTWSDLDWLRARTDLPILVKGVLRGDDARLALEHGVDGIVVSNHGGRQVDGSIASLDALVEVRDEVGPDATVLMDGGIRRAADILKALALGADAVLLGRLYAYGLAVGGAAGVEAVIRQLAAELDLTMALAGVRSVRDLDRSLVSLMRPLVRIILFSTTLATAALAAATAGSELAVGDGEGRLPPGRAGRLRDAERLHAAPGGRCPARRPDHGGTAARDRERSSSGNAAPRRLGHGRCRDRSTWARSSRPERTAASLSARVTQLVLTATSVSGVKSVRLLVKGGYPARPLPRLCDVPTDQREIRARSRPAAARRARHPSRPPTRRPPYATLQQRLADLSFLPPDAVDGKAGEQTRFAVMAFQKWQGLGRDGTAGPATMAALAAATRPTPRTTGAGRRFEVLLDRQLVLYIENGAVVRTLHVSSGATGYETPTGRFSVFRKETQLVVGAVQGLAPLGELLRRRRCLPRVSRRPRPAGIARLRASAPLRREVAVRPRADGTAVTVLGSSR